MTTRLLPEPSLSVSGLSIRLCKLQCRLDVLYVTCSVLEASNIPIDGTSKFSEGWGSGLLGHISRISMRDVPHPTECRGVYRYYVRTLCPGELSNRLGSYACGTS